MVEELKLEINDLRVRKILLEKDLERIKSATSELYSTKKSAEEFISLHRDYVFVLTKIVDSVVEQIKSFSEAQTRNLDLLFPEKKYHCEFEFVKDSEGYYKEIKYKVYSNGKLIKDLESQEGASLLNINSSLSLIEIVSSGQIGPKILFLDESFANLDSSNWAKLEPYLEEICREKDLQLFLISHHTPLSENVITI